MKLFDKDRYRYQLHFTEVRRSEGRENAEGVNLTSQR